MIKTYRKKPVVIEAIQWNGKNDLELRNFMGEAPYCFDIKDKLVIETSEGNMKVNEGDFIIKGVEGEFYPCKKSVFKKTYEQVINEEDKLEEKKENVSNQRCKFVDFNGVILSSARIESMEKINEHNIEIWSTTGTKFVVKYQNSEAREQKWKEVFCKLNGF